MGLAGRLASKQWFRPTLPISSQNNSLKNGLLPIRVDQETYHQLVSLVQEEPETRITVDLAAQALVLPDGQQIGFPIDAFAKHCLLNGVDQLGFLQSQEDRDRRLRSHTSSRALIPQAELLSGKNML